MADKLFGEAFRNIRVCVDSYESGVMSGRVYYAVTGEDAWAFSSAMQLLIELDRLMDEANFPQSFTGKRSFSMSINMEDHAKVEQALPTGELATFVVRVVFRQHSSWQGEVTWVEGDSKEPFRSALELLILFDSALSSQA